MSTAILVVAFVYSIQLVLYGPNSSGDQVAKDPGSEVKQLSPFPPEHPWSGYLSSLSISFIVIERR